MPLRSLRLGSTLLLVSVLLAALPASAQRLVERPTAVVELFTSQGCSSCPPADALLSELAARQDIVALAYHVDYWDYAGWVDTFGSPENSDRQRAYAAARGSTRIYTPQIIVNGLNEIVGSRAAHVHAALARTGLELPVRLLTRQGMLEIEIDPDPDFEPAMIWIVNYRDSAAVRIGRGENGGRAMTYSHVVVERRSVGMWDPREGASVKLPLEELTLEDADGIAILVQSETGGMPGPILGAALYGP